MIRFDAAKVERRFFKTVARMFHFCYKRQKGRKRETVYLFLKLIVTIMLQMKCKKTTVWIN